jgi:predicted ATP-grasp superfamily ATP-dependent carboligase
MGPGEHLLIFGASARAAAFSALRAGFRPWCADLFADADLRAACPAVRLPGRYPEAFAELVRAPVRGPWLYTGGLENHPDLVGRMAQLRPLWGNGAEVLRRVRDPQVLAAAAREAGLPAPRLCRGRSSHPGRWLVKPLAGSGGAGVRFHDGRRPPRGDVYLQEFIEGLSVSAVFTSSSPGTLVGLTRQLVGEPFLNAPPFRYAGNVGPLPAGDQGEGLVRLGHALALAGVRGVFGVDGVLNHAGFWPVEVNPRYTASVEVLEHATGWRAMHHHARQFTGAVPLPGVVTQGVVGKAVLYAPADGVFPAEGPWAETLHAPPAADELPAFADVPHPGEPLRRGRPVLTLLCRGGSADACLAELRRRAAEAEAWLYR